MATLYGLYEVKNEDVHRIIVDYNIPSKLIASGQYIILVNKYSDVISIYKNNGNFAYIQSGKFELINEGIDLKNDSHIEIDEKTLNITAYIRNETGKLYQIIKYDFIDGDYSKGSILGLHLNRL